MEKVEDVGKIASCHPAGKLPVSVIIAARNEEKNLSRCLQALRDFGEVYVIDSQARTRPSRLHDLMQLGSCSFIIRADGPRSGNGRWIRCPSFTTGFFCSMPTRCSPRNSRKKSVAQF